MARKVKNLLLENISVNIRHHALQSLYILNFFYIFTLLIFKLLLFISSFKKYFEILELRQQCWKKDIKPWCIRYDCCVHYSKTLQVNKYLFLIVSVDQVAWLT